MRSRWKKRRQHDAPELNITSFMNLMVILVPFLLITAVFSQTAILELNIPTADSVVTEDEPEFALEVTVRADALEIGDRNAGVLSRLPLLDGKYDLNGLTTYLKRVKATFPDQLAVTLLLEPAVDYEALVHVMDAVRSFPIDEPGNFSRAELFPEISIGDAPPLAQGG